MYRLGVGLAPTKKLKISMTKKPTKTQLKQIRRAQGSAEGFDLKGKALVMSLRLLALLPLAWLRLLGSGLGWLLWRTNVQATKVSRENIAYAYPEQSAQAREILVKQAMLESGKTATEMAAVWARDDQWLLGKVVAVTNEHLLITAQEQGRGVIVLSPHLGNWEALGRYLGRICADITMMYQPAQLPAMDKLIRHARLRNMNVATADRAGVMQLLKALRRGGVLGILPDQVPTEGAGEFADFYSLPALTMTLIRQLYKKTGAEILMVYGERVAGGFNVVIQPPDPSIYAEDPAEALRGLNLSVEQCVDRLPEQYQWQYKRYRKQPEGMPRPYQFK